MRYYTACIFQLLLLAGLAAAPLQAAEKQLVILNWSDYLSPELVAKFETRYGVKVTQIYYESDEQRTQMLVDNDASGYDLILTSGIDLSFYAQRGWIQPLDPAMIPNLSHLSPIWRSAFQDAERFGVPFFWGTVGIIYRRDLLQEPITHWRQLYQPAADLQGKIGMIADGRDLVSLGLKALGHPLNSADQSQLSDVESLLVAQQPYVKSYQYMNLGEHSEIISGEIWASMIYSGDAVMVQQHSDQLLYVVPAEGSNIWVDYFTLGAKAREPQLASAFLNFINQPDHAAAMAQQLYYATPNSAAEKLLPAAFLADPRIYPPAGVLERCEFYRPLAPRALRRRNALSARILR